MVAVLIVLPLLMIACLGFSWFGHMADVKGVCQEASSAGARWLASHPGDVAGGTAAAMEVTDQAAGNGFMPPYTGNGHKAELRILCRDNAASGGRGIPAWPLRADNYAQCVVWYDYPIPIKGFWYQNAHRVTPAWGGVGSDNSTAVTLAGESFYPQEP